MGKKHIDCLKIDFTMLSLIVSLVQRMVFVPCPSNIGNIQSASPSRKMLIEILDAYIFLK